MGFFIMTVNISILVVILQCHFARYCLREKLCKSYSESLYSYNFVWLHLSQNWKFNFKKVLKWFFKIWLWNYLWMKILKHGVQPFLEWVQFINTSPNGKICINSQRLVFQQEDEFLMILKNILLELFCILKYGCPMLKNIKQSHALKDLIWILLS